MAYSATLDPKTVAVLKTYAHFHGIKLQEIARKDGVTDKENLKNQLAGGHIAGFIAQQPNYYGVVEDFTGVADACHDKKALFVINSVIADLALMKTPGEWGEPTSPWAMSEPRPADGLWWSLRRLHVLHGEADPQDPRTHRRQDQGQPRPARLRPHAPGPRAAHPPPKATSNICSNESLMALFATIYCSIMGKEGIKEAAQIGLDGAHTLCEKLVATGKAALVYKQPFFNEFLVRVEDRDAFYDRCLAQGILPGVKVDDDKLLIAVTEKRTLEEIDQLTAILNNK